MALNLISNCLTNFHVKALSTPRRGHFFNRLVNRPSSTKAKRIGELRSPMSRLTRTIHLACTLRCLSTPNKGGQKAVGAGNIIQRRLLNGQKSGRESNHKRPNPILTPGSPRQNPIQTQLLACGGNRGGSAVAHGNRSRAAGARSDGVGDFGFNVRPVFPGYDIKPEGVSAETDTIEGHNIPKKGQAPYAI